MEEAGNSAGMEFRVKQVKDLVQDEGGKVGTKSAALGEAFLLGGSGPTDDRDQRTSRRWQCCGGQKKGGAGGSVSKWQCSRTHQSMH
jgi:hypothetical protein